MTLPYRDFYYPLNVFMHILTLEEGAVPHLHYGLFENESDSIVTAQERSTNLLFSRLPASPAKILEVGVGLGTTLARLVAAGYDAKGITPDEQQITALRRQRGEELRVECAKFESYDPGLRFDTVVFQESSQYIDSSALFARAAGMTDRVLVLDEFALRDVEGLHSHARFVEAARAHGFSVFEELDLSEQAAPSIDYFQVRFERYRELLINDLGLTSDKVDELIEGGVRYRQRYRSGDYGYRFLDLRKTAG
ncbi:MAG: class I SAM-dependent methyltransferase [Acidobacteriota bacterium]